MPINVRVVLGLNEQVLIMYWRMLDLWSPINLVASITNWSNCNCYCKVIVGGRMR
jgi:hypothetical protein